MPTTPLLHPTSSPLVRKLRDLPRYSQPRPSRSSLRVSSAASNDVHREVLNGVFFTPEDGGLLIATDGRRLSGIPAAVPMSAEFVLPNAAVKVLGHRSFTEHASTVTVVSKDEKQLVCFHTKNATLISKTLVGRFPRWKQVVPAGGCCFG